MVKRAAKTQLSNVEIWKKIISDAHCAASQLIRPHSCKTFRALRPFSQGLGRLGEKSWLFGPLDPMLRVLLVLILAPMAERPVVLPPAEEMTVTQMNFLDVATISSSAGNITHALPHCLRKRQPCGQRALHALQPTCVSRLRALRQRPDPSSLRVSRMR